MEIISLNGLITVTAICAISFIIGRLTSVGRKDVKRLETELDQSREELKKYRSQVTSHFQETARRVNAMTESYRNVHEHLAQGAQSLCDKSDAPELMNELNRNPMLSDQTIEELIADPEASATEAETAAEIDPAPEAVMEGGDENQAASSGQDDDKDGEINGSLEKDISKG
jgi:uncharacterized membrane-anchored protein YhcB (DUF1043 family)